MLMAVATTTLLAVSAGVGLYSASQNAAAMGMQAEQERTNAEINSRIAAIRQKDAEEQGKAAVSKFNRDSKRFLGTQKAAAAASGVDVNTGSFQKLREETELLMIEDESRVKNNAMLEAWGYKVQGQNALLQGQYNADALRNRANATMLGGVLNAGLAAYEAFGAKKPKVDPIGGGDRPYVPRMEP